MNHHFMLDIETWGKQPYSVIIALGAVHFNPNVVGEIFSRFYVAIDPVSAQKAGLRIDADTVAWWMNPEQRAALDRWFSELKLELPMALDGFTQWLDVEAPEIKERMIWGNGASFDNMLLANAYQAVNEEQPWKYYGDRCFRTMKNLIGARDIAPPIEGTAHHALDDAVQQARWLQNIIYQNNIAF